MEPENQQTSTEQAILLLNSSGPLRVCLLLSQIADGAEAAQIADELVRHAYWKQKNLPATLCIAVATVSRLQRDADVLATADATAAYDLRSREKTFLYNMASFTWVGWEEPDIAITPAEASLGLEAASLNLKMAQDLNKGNLAISRAHWMYAAQLLVTRNYSSATVHFQEATSEAEKAEAPTEALLGLGFLALTNLLEADTPDNRAAYENGLAQLRALPDGEDFAGQIITARRVFERHQPA